MKSSEAKHKFTTDDSDIGDCGAPYCRGNCGTLRHNCVCGFQYTGKKNKQTELEHVLKAEGLYDS